MANDVTLTSATRQNLISLQNTASLASSNQSRLSTGKKVNSALDNPVNFFTASGLTDRAGALTSLLDGVSNGIQTIQAASKGLDSITSLVKSLQSTISQAQADAATNRPTKTSTAALGGTSATDAKAAGLGLRDAVMGMTLGGATAGVPSASTSGNLGITTAANGKVVIQLSDGETTFKKTLNDTAKVSDLVTAINSSGIASASIDDSGKLTVTGISDKLTIGIGGGADEAAATTAAASGTTNSNAAVGFAVGDAVTSLTGGTTSAIRSNLINQFNSTRDQIDQLAKDSGFNGTNLLNGDTLNIIFNEKTGNSQSKLSVLGNKLGSDSLGVNKAVNGTALAGEFNVQSDKSLAQMQDTLKSSMSSLKSISSSLGSNLSTVQTRQEFTKQIADVLNTGASNLTDADMNEEAAKSNALSTRQSLGISALSLANQAAQGVLQLLR